MIRLHGYVNNLIKLSHQSENVPNLTLNENGNALGTRRAGNDVAGFAEILQTAVKSKVFPITGHEGPKGE